MSWNCPNCGSECSSRFCPNCGTPQPELDGDPNASKDIVEGILPKESDKTTSFEEEQRQEMLVPDEDAAESIVAPSGEDEPSSGSDSAETDEDALILTDEETFTEAELQERNEESSDDGAAVTEQLPSEDSPDSNASAVGAEPGDISIPASDQSEMSDSPVDVDNVPMAPSPAQNDESKLPDKRKRMVFGAAVAVVLVLIVLFSTHVICVHDWIEATCTESKYCSICGEVVGEPLGHDWQAATCTEPRTCSRCDKTEGKPLGHEKVAATCTEPERCTRCQETFGEPLGHDIQGLTCTTDGVCSRCGEVFPAEGHQWVEATCTAPKTCSVCGQTEGEPLGHTTANGVCERCGMESYATQTGSGDSVVSDISTGDSIYRVHFTNSGSRNFAIWSYDSTGERDLLVNTIGNYDGRVLLLGSSPFSFEVTSSGNWSYTVEPLGTTDTTSFSGHGDYVTDIFPASSGSWRFTHDGSGNFAVWVYTTDGRDLPVNTIGTYDGTRMISIPAGSNAFFAITADGNWTISPA